VCEQCYDRIQVIQVQVGWQQFVAFHKEDRDHSQETSPYKVLETGYKKGVTILHSRMHENWEVAPVAWRGGMDEKK